MRVRYVAQVRDRGAGRRRQHHVCDGSLPTVTFTGLQCERGVPIGRISRLACRTATAGLSSDSCVSRRRQTVALGRLGSGRAVLFSRARKRFSQRINQKMCRSVTCVRLSVQSRVPGSFSQPGPILAVTVSTLRATPCYETFAAFSDAATRNAGRTQERRGLCVFIDMQVPSRRVSRCTWLSDAG